jgi:hypothetical protein
MLQYVFFAYLCDNLLSLIECTDEIGSVPTELCVVKLWNLTSGSDFDIDDLHLMSLMAAW